MARTGSLHVIGLAALLAVGCSSGDDDASGGDGTGGDGSGAADATPLVGACAADATIPETGARTLSFGGRERTYLLHIPAGYDRSATPLVLNFHGFTSNPEQQEYFSVMSDAADREGFAVAYPQGVGDSFNAGACCGTAANEDLDDVGFTAAVIDAVAAEMCLDPARVYSTGFSNGGFLSHRLACQLSDRIAAIAPVSGVMGIEDCSPSRPVPVLHFHGTADALVPFDGGGIAGFPSVEDTLSAWAERDGCTGERQVSFEQGDALCQRWDSCDQGTAVELCVIDGGGHTWPGGLVPAVAGKTSHDIVATDRMWQFFSEHPLPDQ
jgi:polyhydroxybutyrate depolymerase